MFKISIFHKTLPCNMLHVYNVFIDYLTRGWNSQCSSSNLFSNTNPSVGQILSQCTSWVWFFNTNVFLNLKYIYGYIFFLLILPEQFLKFSLTFNKMVQWQAICLLVLFLNFPFHSLLLSLIINTSSFLADLFDTHTSMFTLFCRKVSFCLFSLSALETSTLEEK